MRLKLSAVVLVGGQSMKGLVFHEDGSLFCRTKAQVNMGFQNRVLAATVSCRPISRRLSSVK
jgi:hypothetical protein